jgi:hypothetical protein
MSNKTNWKTKVSIGVGIAAVLGSLLFIVKTQNDIIQKQNSIEKSFIEQKRISNDITRAQSSLMTKKDLKKFAAENEIDLDPIKKDLRKLGAKVEGIQTVRVYTTGYSGTNISSTGTTPNPDPVTIDPNNPDPYGYLSRRQELSLTEPFGDKDVPFGEVGFSSWKPKPWDVTVLPREYGVDTVVGVDEDGRHIPYTKLYVSVDGERHDIKVSETKWREVLPTSKFRFNPRLYAGIDGGAYLTRIGTAVTPNVQVSLFSYGKTRTDPVWTFAGLGLGYEVVDDSFAFVLSPFSYNVGQHLPLVDNVHIRPTVLATPGGEFGIMTGLGFGL